MEYKRGQPPSRLHERRDSGQLVGCETAVSSNLRVEDCKFIPRFAAQTAVAIRHSPPKADPGASRMERDGQAYAMSFSFVAIKASMIRTGSSAPTLKKHHDCLFIECNT